jgi:hypothetical protein
LTKPQAPDPKPGSDQDPGLVPKAEKLRHLALLVLVAGLVLTLVFVWRGWRQWEYQQRLVDGQVQVEALRGWMTLPYIERAHGLPQSAVREALGLPAQGGDDRSLHEWFEIRGIDPMEGRNRVEALILDRSDPSAPTAPP